MTKFNTTDKRAPRTGGVINTAQESTVLTYNGGTGYEYDTLSQLFLLACSNMVGEKTYYEDASTRDARYVGLIQVAVAEGHVEWLARFFPWLRNQANMRTASIVGAIETARAMRDRKISGSRAIVNSVLTRADEPAEALAYWMSTYGRAIPKPIKRGIADAATRLYTERNTIKHDTASKGLRFGDVLELTHAEPKHINQSQLFKYLVDRSKGRTPLQIPDVLTMLVANEALRKQAVRTPELLLNTARLNQAGMTWEAAKSLVGGRVSDKDIWEALIPVMGYMALLRNLRNFEQAEVSGNFVDFVNNTLADPAEVASSRQLPTRFLSAYRSVVSNKFSNTLEKALELCLGSIPTFKGSTLILIDTSSSMDDQMSGRSKLTRTDTAIVFGLAMARRCENATVVSFSTSNKVFPHVKGESLLKSIDRFHGGGYIYHGGTNTATAVQAHYRNHDRVIILTDEQADWSGVPIFAPVPKEKMGITFNLAGDVAGHAPTGWNRLTFGGLSDAAFTMLHSIEGRSQGVWPF